MHFEELFGAGTYISEPLADGVTLSQEKIHSVRLLSDDEVAAWRARLEARLRVQARLENERL